MQTKNYLTLVQKIEDSDYNDFIGKYYHFPGTSAKSYLNQFKDLPVEFVYFDPVKESGSFFGCGKITKPPFEDKREPGYYFAEIESFQKFPKPVFYKNEKGEVVEKIDNPQYNAQNAVRVIPQKTYDRICLDGGAQLNFKADAHLVQVLGEQLIASERVGILELVKNAYDANASNCTVRFEKVPDLPPSEGDYQFKTFDGPVIVITDDGDGMNKNIIENGWLRPASTIKTNVKEEIKRQRKQALESGDIGIYDRWLKQYKKANKGRLPLGEKGVGRFATHRLGRNLIIKTKTADIDFEYVLTINWDDFDIVGGQSKDLDSVAVDLIRQKPSIDYGSGNSGTQIIIYGGRDGFNLSKDIIEEIYASIQKLNSPNLNNLKNRKEGKSTGSNFNAFVECPQIGEFVSESIYDLADPIFTLDGIVDEKGILNFDLKFNPPKSNQIPFPSEVLAEDNYLDLRKTIDGKNPFKIDLGEYRKPECGGFYVHLDLWYRISPWIDTINTKKIQELLDDYGGISIYRDSLNLFPAEWGAELDWLNLTKRHIKKGSNISYYNMMGYVELEQGKNIELVDKTDRQGLIENTAFNDLSHLVAAIVFRVELDYKLKRDSLTDIRSTIIKKPTVIHDVSNQTSSLVENIIDRYDIVKDPIELFDSISSLKEPNQREEKLIDLQRSLKELEKSAKQMAQIEEQLVEEAGYGKAVAVSIHELAKTTTNLYNGIIRVLKSGRPKKSELEDLRKASGSLRSELKNLSPLRTIRNEKKQEFDIIKSINFVKSVFKRRLNSSKIELTVESDNSFTIYARYGAVNQILSNLIDNSIYWLDTLEKTDPNYNSKKIHLRLNKEFREIVVADNGPGIDNAILPYLFKSGASMRNPPSGLGLYICRYYMNRMKGDIYLTPQKDKVDFKSGAQFTLDFSRTPGNIEKD